MIMTAASSRSPPSLPREYHLAPAGRSCTDEAETVQRWTLLLLLKVVVMVCLCSGVQAVNIDVLQQHTTLEINSSTVFFFLDILILFPVVFAVVVFLHSFI